MGPTTSLVLKDLSILWYIYAKTSRLNGSLQLTNNPVSVSCPLKNGITRLDPFTIRANVLNIERPIVMVNTSLVPSDLSVVPVIDTTPVSADVRHTSKTFN